MVLVVDESAHHHLQALPVHLNASATCGIPDTGKSSLIH